MTDVVTGPLAARGELELQLSGYRRELTGYCYRMLGSAFDAEDAVQDTMVRAWRALETFEGRASLRSWVYRIATNVCLDSLDGRNRRALPLDLSTAPSPPVEASLGRVLPDASWVEPVPDDRVLPEGGDPADLAVQRESIRLAFVAALQHLPPRQRAVLVLRDVLRWRADEVAGLLDTTVPAVNSALQRARATLGALDADRPVDPLDAEHRALLERYVDAFERYDIDGFVALLHEDATQDMPPFAMWLRGPADIGAWMLGPGRECRGSRLLPLVLNGQPGFAHYRLGEQGHHPFALQLVTVTGGGVAAITSFLDTRLFALFGLPETVPARAPAS